MSFLVLIVIVAVAALFYIFATPQPAARAKWAELARLVFAAAVFALLLSIALGTHDAILRVVK